MEVAGTFVEGRALHTDRTLVAAGTLVPSSAVDKLEDTLLQTGLQVMDDHRCSTSQLTL